MIDLEKYFEFLSIPSISSEKGYTKEVYRCAKWVVAYLQKIGFQVELWETNGHPIVFATTEVDSKKPTLLIYNHYDVQPIDPIELWDTPPFTPTLKGDQIYARGAQDNKGQAFYVFEALRNMKSQLKQFPINIKLCIEGEEECGSHSLSEILEKKSDRLKADYLAIVDCGIPTIDTPAIALGTRGLVTFDMEVKGSKGDLHSGSHGGIAYNPLHALVKILSEVRNEKGEISIPGFYEDVAEISEDLSKISCEFDEKRYQTDFGIPPSGGENDFTPLERLWLRPTFEINGISGGYSGEGFKTVIPAKAKAKFSCRLVPHQKPEKMGKLIRDYFMKKAPPGIEIDISIHEGGGEAARAKLNSTGIQTFAKAFSQVFKKPCRYILEGASIPIVPKLAKASGAEPILMGLGLPTDQIHAPNEHFGIDRLEKGMAIIMEAIELLSKNR